MKLEKSLFGLTLLVALIIFTGCSGPLAPARQAVDSSSALRVIGVEILPDGTSSETGVLGPGALYEILVPHGWEQGNLVLYAHGYVSPYDEPALPDDLNDSTKVQLLSQGFAIAYSSFSETGWAVKDGAIRTRQLLGHFKDNYGDPHNVFLVGGSQGGLIALLLAEQNPNLFDGVLSISAPLGGGKMQMEYIVHIRVLFDYFFRETLRSAGFLAALPAELAAAASLLDSALGGGALDADGSGLPDEVIAPLVASLLLADPPTAAVMATMVVDNQPLFNWPQEMVISGAFLPELVGSITAGLWFNIYGTQDLLNRTNGHVPVDNRHSVYFSPLLDLVIEDVERLASHPAGVNYLTRWYRPNGRLRLPVVTVHTTRDPTVPVWHAHLFREVVERAGAADFLVQFEIDGFGHAELLLPPGYEESDPEFEVAVLNAFQYLVAWVGP